MRKGLDSISIEEGDGTDAARGAYEDGPGFLHLITWAGLCSMSVRN